MSGEDKRLLEGKGRRRKPPMSLDNQKGLTMTRITIPTMRTVGTSLAIL